MEHTGGSREQGFHIAPAGDEAVLVEFGPGISRALHRKVRALAERLEMPKGHGDESPPAAGLVELVPGYSSLLVRYDSAVIGYRELVGVLRKLAAQADGEHSFRPRRIEIPVRYGGDDGPDLQFVADHVGLDVDAVVRLHAERTYIVYMLGFTPGFCYLGDLHPALTVPRRESPRLRMPPGAVAVGGAQTGVYSLESPGGWRWIGRTDAALWDHRRDPPALLRAGDEVRFVPM